jgi:hypothetical protein
MNGTTAVAIEEPNDAAELMADRLEEPPEKRVAIMQPALEAQRAALLQLAVIIKQRVNRDEQLANIARQSEVSAATSRLADAGRVQLATNIRGADTQAPHVTSIAAQPEAGHGDLHSSLSSANGETPGERQYPKLMAHRQSELQLVDTSKNGIWYRLVVLPTGSHQEAPETCGRLGAAGYDRCWVKAY